MIHEQMLKLISVSAKGSAEFTCDFPPETMPDKFSEANQKISESLSANLKLVLGDAYTTSPIIVTDLNKAQME
jgi:hypothetical protein